MFKALGEFFARLFKRSSNKQPPDSRDPFSYRAVPVRRAPPDKGGAIALAEPDDE